MIIETGITIRSSKIDYLRSLITYDYPTDNAWRAFTKHLPERLDWWSCWVWTGSVGNNGYGFFVYKKKVVTAHRQLLTWLYGELGKLVVDHVVCNNRSCTNPLHLIPTTNKINTLRGNSPAAQKSRQRYQSWFKR